MSRTERWLDECAFPEAVWARLRIFSDGSADECWVQGEMLYGFDSAECARYFLSEDEYVCFEGLDANEERVHEVRISDRRPRTGGTHSTSHSNIWVPIDSCQGDRRVVHSRAGSGLLQVFERKAYLICSRFRSRPNSGLQRSARANARLDFIAMSRAR